MKKVLIGLMFLIVGVFFAACSTSKEGRKMKYNISGDWVLEKIVTEGIKGQIKAKIFNETEYSCFIGSTWNFIGNNSMGSYTLDGMTKDCPAMKRLIRWSIYEPKNAEKEFQFKRLDDKKNSIDNGDGFRLRVTALGDKNMELKSDITFEGQPAAIIYNFVRK